MSYELLGILITVVLQALYFAHKMGVIEGELILSDLFYSLVTDIGNTKELEAIENGQPFEVYQIAIGDGNGRYYEPTTSQTELRNEVWRGLIDKCSFENEKFFCTAVIPADVGGFTIREAGIFDGDNNLLVVSKFPETIKQDPSTGVSKEIIIKVEVHLVNTELTSLIINPNITLATKNDVIEAENTIKSDIESDYQKLSEKSQPNGYAPLDENGIVPNVHIRSKSSFALFDIVKKDHILDYEESKGLALLGSYVYKEEIPDSRYGYPDFYNKCLEEKENAEPLTINLSNSTITVYKNANGHIFYDIADKDIIDNYYNATRIAWYYGIDTENERIFLPRNDYIFQNGTLEEVGNIIRAGVPNITGGTAGMQTANQQGDAYGCFYQAYLLSTTDQSWGGSGGYNRHIFDASRCSAVYGASNTVQMPGLKTLLYMVVGNNESIKADINIANQSITENDTIPLFTGQYFDFKPNNISWLKGGTRKSGIGTYEFIYNKLVNCLTDNKYSLKVIDEENRIDGIDYSEYWKVNQNNITFETPKRIGLFGTVGQRFLVAKKEPTDSDNRWYNWYSDGWCEQGGIVDFGGDATASRGWSAALPIPYLKNDYSRTAVDAGNTSGSGHVWTVTCTVPSSSTTSVGGYCLKTEVSIRYVSWRTEGYAAIPNPETDYQEELNLYFKVANAVQNIELIDVNEAFEAMNNKIDRSECVSYVVESYRNGTSWYRVWSDGFIEQGGIVGSGSGSQQITLLKSYKDTSYHIQATCRANNLYATAGVVSTNTIWVETRGHDYTVQGCTCFWCTYGY